MLFLIFEKGDEQKNCARYFEIHKYAFLIFENRDEQKKIVPGILRFGNMLFLIFEKGDERKNCVMYF